MNGQKTLKTEARASGIGLHSGRQVDLTLHPAPANAGIVFKRVDLGPTACVRATATNVIDTHFATTLGQGDVRVATVEHLMAAFAGFGIDNAEVRLSGAELPILDGSAEPFVKLIERAGVEQQAVAKRYLKVVREVTYTDGRATAKLSPHNGFRVEYTMHYDHSFFVNCEEQCRHATVDISTETFVGEICRARTFGFLGDLEELHAAGRALGASLDNAIVIDDDGVLNDEGLRFADEPVKHKVLDVIGDLHVCGYPIIGAFSGYQSGHSANNGLLRRLLDDPSAYETVTV